MQCIHDLQCVFFHAASRNAIEPNMYIYIYIYTVCVCGRVSLCGTCSFFQFYLFMVLNVYIELIDLWSICLFTTYDLFSIYFSPTQWPPVHQRCAVHNGALPALDHQEARNVVFRSGEDACLSTKSGCWNGERTKAMKPWICYAMTCKALQGFARLCKALGFGLPLAGDFMSVLYIFFLHERTGPVGQLVWEVGNQRWQPFFSTEFCRNP